MNIEEMIKVESDFENVFELREFLAEVQEMAARFPNVKVTFEEL